MATLMTPAAEVPPIRIDEHGAARVGNTRITLELLVAAFNDGLEPDQIAAELSALTLRDVYGAIHYYLGNKDEVDRYVAERAEMAAEVRQMVEAACPRNGFKERLLARRAEMAS